MYMYVTHQQISSFWTFCILLFEQIFFPLQYYLQPGSQFVRHVFTSWEPRSRAPRFFVTLGLLIFFLHPAVSHVFHGSGFQGPGFSVSRFFRVHVFQGSDFSGSGPGSRFQKQPLFLVIFVQDSDSKNNFQLQRCIQTSSNI